MATPCTTIVSYYNRTNTSDKTDITTLYNELSFLVEQISKRKVHILGGDMNAQICKDGNNKFCLHNLPKRNDEYLADF